MENVILIFCLFHYCECFSGPSFHQTLDDMQEQLLATKDTLDFKYGRSQWSKSDIDWVFRQMKETGPTFGFELEKFHNIIASLPASDGHRTDM